MFIVHLCIYMYMYVYKIELMEWYSFLINFNSVVKKIGNFSLGSICFLLCTWKDQSREKIYLPWCLVRRRGSGRWSLLPPTSLPHPPLKKGKRTSLNMCSIIHSFVHSDIHLHVLSINLKFFSEEPIPYFLN